MLQAVFGVEAVDPSPRFTCRVVPDVGFVAVGIEDDRTLAELFLKPVRIHFCLSTTDLRIFGCAFCFNHGQWHAVVVEQNVVRIAFG